MEGSRVPPIPKSSNKSDPGNYRPISLLSVLSKILEEHVRNLLVDYLEDFHPLSTQQWASPMVNPPLELYLLLLIAGTDYLTQGLTSALYFLTSRKSFDTVPHRPLLQEFKDVTIHSHILR